MPGGACEGHSLPLCQARMGTHEAEGRPCKQAEKLLQVDTKTLISSVAPDDAKMPHLRHPGEEGQGVSPRAPGLLLHQQRSQQ